MSTQDREGRAYHHGDLRAALLAAAGEMLAESGAAAISLREVARRAGVSHNAPYRHFPERDSLLAALAAEGFRELAARMAGAGEGQLAAIGQCYVRFALEQPGRFALMFVGGPDKQAHPELGEAAAALYRLLEDAVRLAAPRRDAQIATLAAWSLVHGLAQLLLDRQLGETMLAGEAAEQLAERITRLFVEGLGGG